MARVCVVLAPGFEEIEAVTVIDILRRADIEVWTVGVKGDSVEGGHGIVLEADTTLADEREQTWDAVILPGGLPGSNNLRDSEAVLKLIRDQARSGRWLAAICAAPIALAKAGVLRGRKATVYPGFEDEMGDATLSEDLVVTDGNIITSRGPATAAAFAFTLVKELQDSKIADSLKISTLYTELEEAL